MRPVFMPNGRLAATLARLAGMRAFGMPRTPAGRSMIEGTIRKVDVDRGKVAIRHGPIVELGMPPMTRAFAAKDALLLTGLSRGDNVHFHVVMDGTDIVIDELDIA